MDAWGEDATLAALVEAIRASPHNLMSPRALDELEARHLPECRALARLLPSGPGRVADVGSGGGLPGLVVAVVRPELEVTLVEATGKKARFLEDTAQELGVEVDVVNARIEDATHLHGRFDLATARAVAPLDVLVPWVAPVLRPGGRLYAVKGRAWRDEVLAARSAVRRAGMRVVATPADEAGYAGDVDPPLRVVIIAAADGS